MGQALIWIESMAAALVLVALVTAIAAHWGWFGRWVVISPAAHRIHHSNRPEHYNRNFSNFLTIWDHLFGTWHEGTGMEEPESFGVDDEPVPPLSQLPRELCEDVIAFVKDLSLHARRLGSAT